MAEKTCAICKKPCLDVVPPGSAHTHVLKLENESYEYQDTGEPVHTSCRNGTFWKPGDRVVTRFWEEGHPIATVRSARVVYGKYRRNAFEKPIFGVKEWVDIEYDSGDGARDVVVAEELKKAPEERK